MRNYGVNSLHFLQLCMHIAIGIVPSVLMSSVTSQRCGVHGYIGDTSEEICYTILGHAVLYANAVNITISMCHGTREHLSRQQADDVLLSVASLAQTDTGIHVNGLWCIRLALTMMHPCCSHCITVLKIPLRRHLVLVCYGNWFSVCRHNGELDGYVVHGADQT